MTRTSAGGLHGEAHRSWQVAPTSFTQIRVQGVCGVYSCLGFLGGLAAVA